MKNFKHGLKCNSLMKVRRLTERAAKTNQNKDDTCGATP